MPYLIGGVDRPTAVRMTLVERVTSTLSDYDERGYAMKRERLIRLAKEIPAVEPAAIDAYSHKRDTLAEAVSALLMVRTDLDALIGPGNLAMMRDNHANHARYVESVMRYFDAENLVDTVVWVLTTYRSHGFREGYWPAQLNAWVEVCRAHLSDTAFAAIYPVYHWFIVCIPTLIELANERGDELKLTRTCTG